LLVITSDTATSNQITFNNYSNYNLGTIGTVSGTTNPSQDVFGLGYTSDPAGTDFTPVLSWTSQSRVGIGTQTAGRTLSVDSAIQVSNSTSGFGLGNGLEILHETDGETYFLNRRNANMRFYTNNTERGRWTADGKLLVGTSSARSIGLGSAYPALFQVETTNFAAASFTNNSNDVQPAYLNLGKSRGGIGSNTIVQSGDFLGQLGFAGADGTDLETLAATITCVVDGTPGANDMPGRLVFSTTADGASSPTERMRIKNDGFVLIGKTTVDTTAAGFEFRVTPADEHFVVTNSRTSGGECAVFNRQAADGNLIVFSQAGTPEGTISVSGTTVSYNGAHLSRWSQLPGGATREEILRGTVLSNIDEMCEWGEEDNEQLNRMKVSDVEGDPNVAGVFQCWDDDDTYTDDFYCAMTGDFIIRIAEGVTVQRGDLLMSAGDGTAKPQDDDIIRSKTIAKVTSTHVTCTYDDGSYCVPCVLMAC
jgi:hypothetical protein